MRTLFVLIVEKVRLAFSKGNTWRRQIIFSFLSLPCMRPVLRYVTPNALGYLRIGATFVILGLYMQEQYSLAIALFLFGALTDMIDGPLAEITNNVTEEGKRLDAVADKVLILAPLLFIGSTHLYTITLWMVIFMESLLILVANVLKPYLRQKHDIPLVTGSNGFGQTKMVVQCIGVGVLLLNPNILWVVSTGEILIWIAIGLSVGSMLRHLARLEKPVEPKKRIITIPNLITLSSILSAPFIVSALIHHNWILATALLGWMFISDFFDGIIARKYNSVTNFGAVLDPARDSLARFMLLIWFFFKIESITVWIMLTTIAIVEIAIVLASIIYASRLKTIRLVTIWGRRRAFVHGVACGVVFLQVINVIRFPEASWYVPVVCFFLMFVASLIALISYVSQGTRLLSRKKI